MKSIQLLRRIISLTLLVSRIISFITGLTLLLNFTKTLYWLIPLGTGVQQHCIPMYHS